MPRVCTICTHAEREAIDADLVAGVSYRHIAERFSISTTALQRHKVAHLAAALGKAREAQAVARGDDLLQRLEALCAEARRIKDKAERSADYRTALSGVRELVRIIELLAKLRGELQQEGTVNVVVSVEWITLRTVILEALAPYPEARLAVARALEASHAAA